MVSFSRLETRVLRSVLDSAGMVKRQDAYPQ